MELEKQNYNPAPENHFVKSILVLIFCCVPFGVVALVHASKVENLWTLGQHELAKLEADKANKWANIGLFSGLAVAVLYLIIVAIVGLCDL